MKPIQFEVVEDIQQEDQEVEDERIIDYQIVQAEQQLRSLEDQEIRLQEKYDKIQKKLEKESKNNELLMSYFQKTDTESNNPSGTGTFFIQLRHLEAEIERWENKKERLESITHSLEGNISQETAQRNRLNKKVEELREQCQNAKINQQAKENELKSLYDKLLLINNEVEELKQGVELTKKKIQNTADDSKSFTPEQIAKLIAQKDFLQKEVSEKKAYLENLYNRENTLSTKTENARIKNQKKVQKTFLTSNWLQDRTTIIAKIKNLRKEMKNLESHERGSIRSVERNQQQVENINFNNNEIKLALIAEKNTFMYQKSQFMLDAMEVEKNHTQKLKKRFGQLDKTQKVIEDFKDKTETIMKLNEECATDETRKNLLIEELRTLQKLFYQ